MLHTLAIANYRSLRQLVMPLASLNVVAGPNGSGKSSVYRALRLLSETAQGGVIAALAREGGLSSTLWAGPETISKLVREGRHPVQGTPRQHPISLRMGFGSTEFSYAIDIGMPIPIPGGSAFDHDPEIKSECIWSGPKLRPSSLLVDRHGPSVRNRRSNGDWDFVAQNVAGYDSMLTQIADPNRAPEVLILREQIRRWRFYDHFRVDAESPARQPQIGVRTTVLSHDGRDLAAAIQTIREIGDDKALDVAIDDAFPGATVSIENSDGRFSLAMRQHGLLRPLMASELSDGTLRYLLWIAALLTPRPPELMVLNEPETSLHPDLLPSLARLIRFAAQHSQVWVISHASRLIAALEEDPECHSIMLEKELGETRIMGMRALDEPAWSWPSRG